MLGKVIYTQEGQKFFNLVEKIRKLSKASKVNPNQKKLTGQLLRMSATQNLRAMSPLFYPRISLNILQIRMSTMLF